MFYIAASLVISASYVVAQIFVGELGQAAHQFDAAAVINFLLVLTAVIGVRAVFSALSVLTLRRFAGKTTYKFQVNFVRFFLRQPFAKLEKINSGKNLSVFTNDLPKAVQLISGGVLEMISDSTLLLITVVYMLYMNWLYTLIYLAFFPILALIQAVISMPIQKISKKAQEAAAGFNAVVNDSLQNTATVIAYSLEDELEGRYMSAYNKLFGFNMQNTRLYSVIVLAGFISSAFPLVFLFIASGLAVVEGNMLISEFIVFTGIGMFAAGWLMGLSNTLGDIQINVAGAARLNEFTTGESEVLGDKQSLKTDGKFALSFENVSFAYGEDATDALMDASFEIPHGAKVAIVGGSGSGKSTILKLMLGLYEPREGKINVLGADASSVGKYALREAFSYVPQDSFLFPFSIRENIAGKTELTAQEQAKLEKACRDAGILDFITNLPGGFDAVLSESAENISGGQRQRIAMARAFYKDAPIILFDEATSALDPTTEAEILKSLEEATKDKTVIMVAHRASAKAFCDTVITMEGGRVL